MFIIEFFKTFLFQTYIVFLESSIYILFGFFLAGLIDVFIKQELILRFMTGKGFKPIIYASLFGIPLPLCSCSVIPTALAIDKKGAQREAIMSFMISTPETGVDSIILTYGLLGPVFAIFRPIAAFITALIAGIFCSEDDNKSDLQSQMGAMDTIRSSINDTSVRKDKKRGFAYFKEKGIEVYKSGFVKLFDDVSLWMLIGFLITGLLSAIIPLNFFENYVGSGLLSMVIMALLGIPLYVCPSSSTPIAAALIAKGLNPGAAFVFLLTGPATNATTITVLMKQFGRRFVRIYFVTIFSVSIILGLFFNYLLGVFGITEIGRAHV